MGNGGAMASRGWYGVFSVFVYKNASPVGEVKADFGSQAQLVASIGPPLPSAFPPQAGETLSGGGTSLKV